MSLKSSVLTFARTLSSLLLVSLLNACASTQKHDQYAHDDWENVNRDMQSFNDKLDNVFLKPMAKAYLWSTPKPVDDGVTNFFNNLEDIGNAFNNVLQFKLKDGGSDFARFIINTSVGIAGIFDVGTMLDLPKHDEDFDQTLGVWGVPVGSYMVLPFIGPSSARGVAGLIGDAIFSPFTYTFLLSGGAVTVISMGSGVLDITDTRAGLLTTEKIVKEAAIDRYQFIKSSYLQRRAFMVNDGKITDDEDLLLLDENIDDANTPSK